MATVAAAQRRGGQGGQGVPSTRAEPSPYVTVTHRAPSRTPSAGATPSTLPSSATDSHKTSDNPPHTKSFQQQQHHHAHYNVPTSHAHPQPPMSGPEPTATVVRPVRSRSRLQKQPSRSASNLKAARKPASHHRSLDEDTLTALPRLPVSSGPPQRSSSIHKHSHHTLATDRPETQQRENAPANTGEEPLLSPTPTPLTIRRRNSRSIDQIDGDKHMSTHSTSHSTASSASPPNNGNNRLPRHVALAPYDPSPLNPLYHIPSPPLSNPESVSSPEPKPRTYRPVMSRHTRAPTPTEHANMQLAQFLESNPGSESHTTTHHTDVTEVVRPAVTQEVIREHTVEIVHEEITREIHVHHYFTRIQPIQALEILPARHFLVDPETGEKTEIPAPEGWTMPENLQPRTPDTSILAPITRHYLVNEQHPQGIPEAAPPPSSSRHHRPRKSSNEFKAAASASHKAKWTPFPKTSTKGAR